MITSTAEKWASCFALAFLLLKNKTDRHAAMKFVLATNLLNKQQFIDAGCEELWDEVVLTKLAQESPELHKFVVARDQNAPRIHNLLYP